MKKRRVISLLLVFAMMFSLCATVFADDSEYSGVKYLGVAAFKDISESDWFYNDVKHCVQGSGYHLFEGTSDDTFSPNMNVSRAMFVTILGRFYGIDDDATNYTGFCKFSDVASNTYYTNFCGWAVQRKITDGTGNNKFSPNAAITREDAFTMLGRYLYARGIELYETDSYVESFKDTDQISDYAYDYIEELRKAGIVEGDNGYLRPKDTITRAEMAAIMSRMITVMKECNYKPVNVESGLMDGVYYDVNYRGHSVSLSDDEKLNVLRYVASKIGLTSYTTFENAYMAELQLIRDCVDYDGDPQKTYASLGTYWDTMSNSTTYTYTDDEILSDPYLASAYKIIFTNGYNYVNHRLYGSIDVKDTIGFDGTLEELLDEKLDTKLGAGHSDNSDHVVGSTNISAYYVGSDVIALNMVYYFCGETFLD